MFGTPICMYCKRFNKEAEDSLVCEAYPKKIPDAILSSRVDHRSPYRGDHGLQFESTGVVGDLEAAAIIAEAELAGFGQTDDGTTSRRGGVKHP